MSQASRTNPAIQFSHPWAFAIGVLMVTCGVILHLPDFLSMESMGYHMVGMPMSPGMLWGMASIVGGLMLSTYGLLPSWASLRAPQLEVLTGRYGRALDDAKLTGAHWWLLFVLGIALVIDVMKPATIGFILPGMRAEYGMTTARAALLPLFALTGTTVGSLLWGVLSDRIGRRASILLAAVFFVGTSICGFMPSFAWNLFMCFVMGLSAGGMLPIVYALMAETVPAKMRGWLVILHGGLGTALGYLAASGIAAVFEPIYTWRILWFFGLPTGLLIVFLNRWIPESPRFLVARGMNDAARDVMSRFGIEALPYADPVAVAAQPKAEPTPRRGLLALFGKGLAGHSLVVFIYGLGWGLVNWGFVTFLPTILKDAGLQTSPPALLFYAALVSVPGTVLVAYLYGRWSSRKSMVGFAWLTMATLLTFAFFGSELGKISPAILILMTAVLMFASTAVVSMLSPYAAEVFPTDLRGSGSGLAAASSKMGGMIGPPMIGALLAGAGGAFLPALVTSIPIGLAGLVLLFLGVETRERGLERISAPLSAEEVDDLIA